MPLLCYIVKHLFYIPPGLVAWWLTTSQTEAFVTDGRRMELSQDCAQRRASRLAVLNIRVLLSLLSDFDYLILATVNNGRSLLIINTYGHMPVT
jgi:hypothetical protein